MIGFVIANNKQISNNLYDKQGIALTALGVYAPSDEFILNKKQLGINIIELIANQQRYLICWRFKRQGRQANSQPCGGHDW